MFRLFVAAAALACATAAGTAHAADISIVSMVYSEAHPVPHIHYEGDTESGDVEKLDAVYQQFVHCRTECLGAEGGATAVLTLAGPGGNYKVGLALADYLRANHIATVVERGKRCYSACAFAFLGGTGYAADARVGTYVDRMVEPGSIVGFHAPYYDDDTLRAALEERSPSEILGFNRSNISLMVKELVKWNVDPEIVFHMVDMGPEQTYDLTRATDLYLVRTALPPTPTSAWVTDVPSAVRNACIRLLAVYERTDPLLVEARLAGPFIEAIGIDQFGGTLSGYKLGDDPLSLGHCSVTDESIAGGHDYDVALYMTAGIKGDSLPLLSMFNRQGHFSTAGIGGSPLKRIFQRGGLNHWFLPPGENLDALDRPGELAIGAQKFMTLSQPAMPAMSASLSVVRNGDRSQVLQNGRIWVFVQTGNARLFEAARRNPGAGMSYPVSSDSEVAYFQQGNYPNGTYTSSFGFLGSSAAATIRIVVTGGAAPTEAEAAMIREIQCAAQFEGLRLSC